MDCNKIIIINFYGGSNIFIMAILHIAELLLFSFIFHSFAFLSILYNSKVYI